MSDGDPVVSMVGSGPAPAMLAARALLAGNGVTHRWIDVDADPVGRLLGEHVGLGVERPGRGVRYGSQLPAPAGFVDVGRARVAGDPELTAGIGEQQVGMVVPARTSPEYAEAYLPSAQWRSDARPPRRAAHSAGARAV